MHRRNKRCTICSMQISGPCFFGVILCRGRELDSGARSSVVSGLCGSNTPSVRGPVCPIRCTRSDRTYRSLVPPRARARSRHQINNVYIWTIWHILWVARASARFCLSSHARCSRAYLNAYISWRRALAKRVCMKTLSFQTDGHLNSLLYRPQHSENQRCCGWHFEGRHECFEEISRNPFIF